MIEGPVVEGLWKVRDQFDGATLVGDRLIIGAYGMISVGAGIVGESQQFHGRHASPDGLAAALDQAAGLSFTVETSRNGGAFRARGGDESQQSGGLSAGLNGLA